MSQPDPPHGKGTGLKIFSFILHLWKEQSGSNRPVWRGSLTDVQSGERRHFQSLKGLIRRLLELIGGTVPPK
jgi:hypothetical protein